jgi:hypothetical protein
VAGFSFFFALVVWVTGQGGGGIDGINCHKDISVNAMLSPFSFLGLGKQQDLSQVIECSQVLEAVRLCYMTAQLKPFSEHNCCRRVPSVHLLPSHRAWVMKLYHFQSEAYIKILFNY